MTGDVMNGLKSVRHTRCINKKNKYRLLHKGLEKFSKNKRIYPRFFNSTPKQSLRLKIASPTILGVTPLIKKSSQYPASQVSIDKISTVNCSTSPVKPVSTYSSPSLIPETPPTLVKSSTCKIKRKINDIHHAIKAKKHVTRNFKIKRTKRTKMLREENSEARLNIRKKQRLVGAKAKKFNRIISNVPIDSLTSDDSLTFNRKNKRKNKARREFVSNAVKRSSAALEHSLDDIFKEKGPHSKKKKSTFDEKENCTLLQSAGIGRSTRLANRKAEKSSKCTQRSALSSTYFINVPTNEEIKTKILPNKKKNEAVSQKQSSENSKAMKRSRDAPSALSSNEPQMILSKCKNREMIKKPKRNYETLINPSCSRQLIQSSLKLTHSCSNSTFSASATIVSISESSSLGSANSNVVHFSLQSTDSAGNRLSLSHNSSISQNKDVACNSSSNHVSKTEKQKLQNSEVKNAIENDILSQSKAMLPKIKKLKKINSIKPKKVNNVHCSPDPPLCENSPIFVKHVRKTKDQVYKNSKVESNFTHMKQNNLSKIASKAKSKTKNQKLNLMITKKLDNIPQDCLLFDETPIKLTKKIVGKTKKPNLTEPTSNDATIKGCARTQERGAKKNFTSLTGDEILNQNTKPESKKRKSKRSASREIESTRSSKRIHISGLNSSISTNSSLQAVKGNKLTLNPCIHLVPLSKRSASRKVESLKSRKRLQIPGSDCNISADSSIRAVNKNTLTLNPCVHLVPLSGKGTSSKHPNVSSLNSSIFTGSSIQAVIGNKLMLNPCVHVVPLSGKKNTPSSFRSSNDSLLISRDSKTQDDVLTSSILDNSSVDKKKIKGFKSSIVKSSRHVKRHTVPKHKNKSRSSFGSNSDSLLISPDNKSQDDVLTNSLIDNRFSGGKRKTKSCKSSTIKTNEHCMNRHTVPKDKNKDGSSSKIRFQNFFSKKMVKKFVDDHTINSSVPVDDLIVLTDPTNKKTIRTKKRSHLREKKQDSICVNNVENDGGKKPTRKNKKTVSSNKSPGALSSMPRKGTLKQKRWIANTLKQQNDGYEDDIFDAQNMDVLKLFKIDEDYECSPKISTPKSKFFFTPAHPRGSPRYKDCISPMALENARKVAEEYNYRRNRKKNCETDYEPEKSLTEKVDQDTMPEKRKLDFQEALHNVIEIQKKTEKYNQTEEDHTDSYLSDVSM